MSEWIALGNSILFFVNLTSWSFILNAKSLLVNFFNSISMNLGLRLHLNSYHYYVAFYKIALLMIALRKLGETLK